MVLLEENKYNEQEKLLSQNVIVNIHRMESYRKEKTKISHKFTISEQKKKTQSHWICYPAYAV